MHVKREHVFEDSFRELHRRSHEEWKNRFYIVFEGEEGQDAGGLLREWSVYLLFPRRYAIAFGLICTRFYFKFQSFLKYPLMSPFYAIS